MKLTIQYPFKYTFIQTKPLFRKNLLTLKLHNFKTVEAMTAKIANRPIPSCLFVLSPLHEFSALFRWQVYGQQVEIKGKTWLLRLGCHGYTNVDVYTSRGFYTSPNKFKESW